MAVLSPFDAVPKGLAPALEAQGFSSLTEVQEAVLDPELAGRDLRISSETGSGKTVAIGFAIAPVLTDLANRRRSRDAEPRVLVIAPTRELAAQVGREMTWLLRPLGARVAVVTGGTNLGGDFRTLATGPDIVVGTPGRMLDHVKRGSIQCAAVAAVVLDEADEMLDMGFRDELEGILSATPTERRTHLVSATLPRPVMRLADRYQVNPVRVAGTDPDAANENITHVAHLVRDRDRLAALVNILLDEPAAQTLVFVRTRVSTTEVANQLSSAGFAATPLSGEMGQRERTAALEAFRRGVVRVVVATDVAARGLDIDDVARVVHFDPPDGPQVYTHRSGRTGRAGKTGRSIAFAPPGSRGGVERLARRAGIAIKWAPVPTRAQIEAAADRRLIEKLDDELETHVPKKRHRELAQSLLAGRDPVSVLAAILGRSNHVGPCEARDVEAVAARSEPRRKGPGRDRDRDRDRGSHGNRRPRSGNDFVPFFVSWGSAAGANPSRLLAMVCRRGGVRGSQIGAIRIETNRSVVEVARELADDFARKAAVRDVRNPRVKIAPWRR